MLSKNILVKQKSIYIIYIPNHENVQFQIPYNNNSISVAIGRSILHWLNSPKVVKESSNRNCEFVWIWMYFTLVQVQSHNIFSIEIFWVRLVLRMWTNYTLYYIQSLVPCIKYKKMLAPQFIYIWDTQRLARDLSWLMLSMQSNEDPIIATFHQIISQASRGAANCILLWHHSLHLKNIFNSLVIKYILHQYVMY